MKKLLIITLTLLFALLIQTVQAESKNEVPKIEGTWTMTYYALLDKSLEIAKGNIDKAIKKGKGTYIIKQSGRFLVFDNMSFSIDSKEKVLHNPVHNYYSKGKKGVLIGAISPIDNSTIIVPPMSRQ